MLFEIVLAQITMPFEIGLIQIIAMLVALAALAGVVIARLGSNSDGEGGTQTGEQASVTVNVGDQGQAGDQSTFARADFSDLLSVRRRRPIGIVPGNRFGVVERFGKYRPRTIGEPGKPRFFGNILLLIPVVWWLYEPPKLEMSIRTARVNMTISGGAASADQDKTRGSGGVEIGITMVIPFRIFNPFLFMSTVDWTRYGPFIADIALGIAAKVFSDASPLNMFEMESIIQGKLNAALEQRGIELLVKGNGGDEAEGFGVIIETTPESADTLAIGARYALFGGQTETVNALVQSISTGLKASFPGASKKQLMDASVSLANTTLLQLLKGPSVLVPSGRAGEDGQ